MTLMPSHPSEDMRQTTDHSLSSIVQPPPSISRSCLTRLALALGSVVFTLLLLEAVIHIVEADVVAACERLGIPVVDVRPHLARSGDRPEQRYTGKPLYYEVDWHLNVEGNRLVGEALAEAWPYGTK